MKIRKTIFDSLLISDSERIHTQTIAWILSLDNDHFPGKSEFIKKLFDLNQDESVSDDLYVETELNHIDLFIQTADKQFIIENKLKSSEHSNQTKRYIDSIPESLKDTRKTKYFGFLTLINDEPQNHDWKPISFEKLKNSLKSVQWPEDKRETIFIQEYIQTLENLVGVFNEFVNNHQNFENVFTDGHKKKYEKQPYSDDYKDYIRKNQLETIFQKAFLKIIAKEAGISYDEIGETRGTALIQIYFNEINDSGETFRLGLQFQGKTLKINLVHKNYADSKPEQMSEKLINAFKKCFLNQNEYKSFNKPRSKAYISVSKSLPNEIYEMEKSDLIQLLIKEINIIRDKSQKFKDEIDKGI